MSDFLPPSSPDTQYDECAGDRPKRDPKTYYRGVLPDNSSCSICKRAEEYSTDLRNVINDLNAASANARYLVAKLARSMAVPGIPRVERQSDSGESGVGGQRHVADKPDDVDSCRWPGGCPLPDTCDASFSVCGRGED